MSEDRKTHLEEEFDKHYSSKRGAWTNAWSPTWEDTTPLESSYFGNPWEDFSMEDETYTASGQGEE